MNLELPSVTTADVAGKKVLARCDLDVPLAQGGRQKIVADDTRLRLALKTINYLQNKKAKIIILGHLGRPEGKREESYSLAPVVERLRKLLKAEIELFPNVLGEKVQSRVEAMKAGEALVLENLRFYPGEEKNEEEFARQVASLGEVYVNDAFAVSHREHASMVGIPRFLPSFFGINFCQETAVLLRVFHESTRPVVIVLGGKKKSKLDAAQLLLGWADRILIGGELVEIDGIGGFAQHKKVLADLTKKGEDITLESAREFGKIVAQAGTVIWSGPLGAYEDARYIKGTRVVAEALVKSKAFAVIGGGDTEAAFTKLGLVRRINFVCSGGGAMLHFFALRGLLPGIRAVIEK